MPNIHENNVGGGFKRWDRAECPMCGEEFLYAPGYKPPTCGRFGCLRKAHRLGLLGDESYAREISHPMLRSDTMPVPECSGILRLDCGYARRFEEDINGSFV